MFFGDGVAPRLGVLSRDGSKGRDGERRRWHRSTRGPSPPASPPHHRRHFNACFWGAAAPPGPVRPLPPSTCGRPGRAAASQRCREPAELRGGPARRAPSERCRRRVNISSLTGRGARPPSPPQVGAVPAAAGRGLPALRVSPSSGGGRRGTPALPRGRGGGGPCRLAEGAPGPPRHLRGGPGRLSLPAAIYRFFRRVPSQRLREERAGTLPTHGASRRGLCRSVGFEPGQARSGAGCSASGRRLRRRAQVMPRRYPSLGRGPCSFPFCR